MERRTLALVLTGIVLAGASTEAATRSLAAQDPEGPDFEVGGVHGQHLVTGRPLLFGYAAVESDNPLRLQAGERLSLRLTARNTTIFGSDDIVEGEGLGGFYLQPGNLSTLAIEGGIAGRPSRRTEVRIADNPHEVAPVHVEALERTRLRFDPDRSEIVLEKPQNAVRAFWEIRRPDGTLLLSNWNFVSSGPQTVRIDPTLAPFHTTVYVMGRGILHEVNLAVPAQPGLPTDPVPLPPPPVPIQPSVPDVGPCQEVVRLDPPSADRTWQTGTSIEASAAGSTQLEHFSEVPVRYLLEERRADGTRTTYDWTNNDPLGRTVFRVPTPGSYVLTVSRSHSLRCEVPLTIVAGPQPPGRLDVNVSTSQNPNASLEFMGLLNVTLTPVDASGPYAYYVRVLRAAPNTSTSQGRLVWAGRLQSEGPAKFQLGGLPFGTYRIRAFPAPLERAGSLLTTDDPAGFETVAVLRFSAPTIDGGDERRTPGFGAAGLLIAFAALALLIESRRRK